MELFKSIKIYHSLCLTKNSQMESKTINVEWLQIRLVEHNLSCELSKVEAHLETRFTFIIFGTPSFLIGTHHRGVPICLGHTISPWLLQLSLQHWSCWLKQQKACQLELKNIVIWLSFSQFFGMLSYFLSFFLVVVSFTTRQTPSGSACSCHKAWKPYYACAH